MLCVHAACNGPEVDRTAESKDIGSVPAKATDTAYTGLRCSRWLCSWAAWRPHEPARPQPLRRWFYGFMGFLALWANKFDPASDETYSTVMFSIFNGNTGILVIIALLGTSMSTGSIDSYQNAIVDNISSIYLRNANVLYTRALVVLLNVPCIVCSLQVGPSL